MAYGIKRSEVFLIDELGEARVDPIFGQGDFEECLWSEIINNWWIKKLKSQISIKLHQRRIGDEFDLFWVFWVERILLLRNRKQIMDIVRWWNDEDLAILMFLDFQERFTFILRRYQNLHFLWNIIEDLFEEFIVGQILPFQLYEPRLNDLVLLVQEGSEQEKVVRTRVFHCF